MNTDYDPPTDSMQMLCLCLLYGIVLTILVECCL